MNNIPSARLDGAVDQIAIRLSEMITHRRLWPYFIKQMVLTLISSDAATSIYAGVCIAMGRALYNNPTIDVAGECAAYILCYFAFVIKLLPWILFKLFCEDLHLKLQLGTRKPTATTVLAFCMKRYLRTDDQLANQFNNYLNWNGISESFFIEMELFLSMLDHALKTNSMEALERIFNPANTASYFLHQARINGLLRRRGSATYMYMR